MIFFIILALVFFLEGFGLKNGDKISYFLILILPLCLFLPKLNKTKTILVPKKLGFFGGVFLLLMLISVVVAVDIQRSFERLLLSLAYFCLFIFVFNQKEKITKQVFYLLFGFSGFYIIGSFGLKLLKPQDLLSLWPSSGNNIVVAYYNGHNHLGDWLSLPLTLFFYWLFLGKNKTLAFLGLFVCLPFFVLAYSRSAYFCLGASIFFITGFFILKNKKNINKTKSLIKAIFFLFFLANLVFLFFATTSKAEKLPLFSPIYKFLAVYHGLPKKDFFANRQKYFSDAFFAAKERPLFGLGPGNYLFISYRYSDPPNHITDSSHNLFLDVLAENGWTACFLLFLMTGLLFLKSKKNNWFFVLLALFLNFQTDYTFNIRPFFLLFIILTGLIYQENETINIKKTYFLLSFFLLMVSFFMILGKIAFWNNNKSLAWVLYPLDKNVFKEITQQKQQYLDLLGRFFPADSEINEYLAKHYLKEGNKKKALDYYHKMYFWHPYEKNTLFIKIYQLEKEVNGLRTAAKFLDSYFKKVETIKKSQTSWLVIFEAKRFCLKTYKRCPYKF